MLEFVLHLSRDVPGFRKPVVPSTAAAFAGTFDTVAGEIRTIDREALRAAMPFRWRKAFDRGATLWFAKESRVDADGRHHGHCVPYFELRDRRGRHLNTVYAIPRRAVA